MMNPTRCRNRWRTLRFFVYVEPSARVFVAGGHGMWGVTLGPVTGRLLAGLIATGRPAPDLRPFDPLR